MFRILARLIEILFPPVSDDHPMTMKEYDRWNAAMVVAGSCRRIHQNLVEQRRHDELLKAIRDLKER
jgi:hypothetical protein